MRPHVNHMLIGGAASVPFVNPLSLGSKLYAWFDPSTLPAGAPVALGNGQTWVDRSANGWTATMFNNGGGADIRWNVTTGFNGLNRKLFAGNNFGGSPQNGGVKGGWNLPNTFLNGLTTIVAYALVQSYQDPNSDTLLQGGLFGNWGTAGVMSRYPNNGSPHSMLDDVGSNQVNGAVTALGLVTPRLYSVHARSGSKEWYLDKVLKASNLTNVFGIGASNKRIGFGADGGTVIGFGGQHMDIVVLNADLTAQEKVDLDNWFYARGGLV
jgi:hypothetical protein